MELQPVSAALAMLIYQALHALVTLGTVDQLTTAHYHAILPVGVARDQARMHA